jgi:PAS domain S-box-containing protein
MNKYKHLFDNVRDAIFVTDLQGNFLEANQVALDRTGYTYDEFLKLNLKNTRLKNSSDAIENYIQEVINNGSATAIINYINQNGDIIETEISGKKFQYDSINSLLHISREIKSRNKNHAELLNSIIQKEEKERSSFAHEIIEILGPNLSLVKMYLDTYSQAGDEILKLKLIEKIRITIDKSIDDITVLSNRISPNVLKILGLKVALEAFVKKIKDQSVLDFQVDFSLPDDLPENYSIVLYRSLAELITNIHNHSKASQVSLICQIYKQNIVVEIKDNGIGFNVKKALSGKTTGLKYLISRIESLRGTIDIKSHPGFGTLARFEIPFK